jgi:hypothetical protein
MPNALKLIAIFESKLKTTDKPFSLKKTLSFDFDWAFKLPQSDENGNLEVKLF